MDRSRQLLNSVSECFDFLGFTFVKIMGIRRVLNFLLPLLHAQQKKGIIWLGKQQGQCGGF
jgi:hypothetical protein